MDEPHFSFSQAVNKAYWAACLHTQFDVAVSQMLGDGRRLLKLKKNDAGTAVTLTFIEPTEWPVEINALFNDFCQNLRMALDLCYAGVARSIAKPIDQSLVIPIGEEQFINQAVERDLPNEIGIRMKELLVNRIGPKSDEMTLHISGLSTLQEICLAQKNKLLLPTLNRFNVFPEAKLRCRDSGREFDLTQIDLISLRDEPLTFEGSDVELILGDNRSFGIVWKDATSLEPSYYHTMMGTMLEGVVIAIQHFCEIWPSDDNPDFEALSRAVAGLRQNGRAAIKQNVEFAKQHQDETDAMDKPEVVPEGPLEDIFKQINDCLNNGQTYLAIMTALAIPDICATLATSSDQRGGIGVRYKSWVNDVLDGEVCGLTSDDLWSLRNGVLHEGKMGNDKAAFDRVVFIGQNPNMQINIVSTNSEIGGIAHDRILVTYAPHFCEKLIEGVRSWLSENESDPQVRENINRLIRVWPVGYDPIIQGVECVS